MLGLHIPFLDGVGSLAPMATKGIDLEFVSAFTAINRTFDVGIDLNRGTYKSHTDSIKMYTYHEMAHAIHQQAVGAFYWNKLVFVEFWSILNYSGNPYASNSAIVNYAESWSNFMSFYMMYYKYGPQRYYNGNESLYTGEMLYNNGTLKTYTDGSKKVDTKYDPLLYLEFNKIKDISGKENFKAGFLFDLVDGNGIYYSPYYTSRQFNSYNFESFDTCNFKLKDIFNVIDNSNVDSLGEFKSEFIQNHSSDANAIDVIYINNL